MNHYEFKTMGAGSRYSEPNKDSRPSSNYQLKINFNNIQSNISQSVQAPIKAQANAQQSFPLPQQNDLNISDMKKRLDMLLKQTQGFSQVKNESMNKTVQQKISPKNNGYSLNSSLNNQKQQKNYQQLNSSTTTYLQSNLNSIKFDNKNEEFKNSKTNNIINYNAQARPLYKQQANQNNFAQKISSKPYSVEPKNVRPTSQQIEYKKQMFTSQTNFTQPFLNLENTKAPMNEPKNLPKTKDDLQKPNNIYDSNGNSTTNSNTINIQNTQQKKQNFGITTSTQTTNLNEKKSTQRTSNSLNGSMQFSNFSQNKLIQNSVAKNQQQALQIPNNLFECQYKLRRIHQQAKKIKQDLKQMTESKQYYRKQLSQQWRNNRKQKEQYEEKIIQINNKHAKQISDLNQIIKKKQINIIELVNQIALGKPQQTPYDEKTKVLFDENQKLANQFQEKQQIITQLKSQIVTKNAEINNLSHKIQTIQDQVKNLNNFKNEKMSLALENNFDQILKIQLKSINEFKEMIERLNDKNNQLREKLVESERRNEVLSNENKIKDLKHKSSLNSQIMENAIDTNNKQNTISTLNKKLITLEQRHKSAINEIKAKDEFLKQHLIGRTDTPDAKQYIQNVLSKYKAQFAQSKEQQLRGQLQKALKKIQLYEKYG